jgi:hypothetical protein
MLFLCVFLRESFCGQHALEKAATSNSIRWLQLDRVSYTGSPDVYENSENMHPSKRVSTRALIPICRTGIHDQTLDSKEGGRCRDRLHRCSLQSAVQTLATRHGSGLQLLESAC